MKNPLTGTYTQHHLDQNGTQFTAIANDEKVPTPTASAWLHVEISIKWVKRLVLRGIYRYWSVMRWHLSVSAHAHMVATDLAR